nr:hypothetical protein [uncultured Undibacterium sp.]
MLSAGSKPVAEDLMELASLRAEVARLKHACGLLRASFRLGRDIAELRTYLRTRERHTGYAAAHIKHMQKALTF